MAEDQNEEKRPGEPAWVNDPELQRQMLYHLYLQASDEARALMAPLFEQVGLSLPFTRHPEDGYSRAQPAFAAK